MAEFDVGNFDISFGWHPPDENLEEAMGYLSEIVEHEELEEVGIAGAELKPYSGAHRDIIRELGINLFEEAEGGNEKFADRVRRAVEGMLKIYREEYGDVDENEKGKLFHAIARDRSNNHAIGFIAGYLRRNGSTALITDFALRQGQAIEALYQIHGFTEMELINEGRKAIETVMDPSGTLYEHLKKLGYEVGEGDPNNLRLKLNTSELN